MSSQGKNIEFVGMYGEDFDTPESMLILPGTQNLPNNLKMPTYMKKWEDSYD